MPTPAIDRIRANAEQLLDAYDTSERLLQQAFQDAMPWASQLVFHRKNPNIMQIERLATQLVAIVMATDQNREQVFNAYRQPSKLFSEAPK